MVRPIFQAIPFAHRRLDRQRRTTRTLFGRIANFINGELWGRTTEVSWGILFPKAGFLEGVARHPSQLYAATLEGLCTFVFVQWRFWKSDVTRRAPGRLTGEFLIAYAIARIANEFFRQPDASLVMGMSRGQFYSLFLISGGFILIRIAETRAKRTQMRKTELEPPDGIALFFACELIT